MIIELSNITGEPLQAQIAGQIKALILKGVLKAGYCLPSIRALAREQRVSVITVQRAYETLEREDLLISQPAKGFFVTDLSEDKRQELAGKNFIEKFSLIAATAFKEGLTDEDIIDLVKNIIDKQKNNNILQDSNG